jgi:hypothetical protein
MDGRGETVNDDETPEYTTTIEGWPVSVDKDGGGTPGRAYDGTWTVSVQNGPEFVVDREELRTGTPKTHEQVARMAYDFACARVEDDA